MKFFSQSTNGFYDENIHGVRFLTIPDPDFDPEQDQGEVPFIQIPNYTCKIPSDAVEISEEVHQSLLNGQSEGKIITAGDGGFPVLEEPPEPTHEELILAQIVELENSVTQRRLRESVLGIDNGWLNDLNNQIAALRSELS